MRYPYRFVPNAEVSGAIMSAIFNHYRRDEVLESLQKHGLDYFDADKWYPVDQFINLLAEWSKMPSFMSNLVSVGMAMIYHVDTPDNMDSLSSVDKLLMLGDLHLSQHRNGDVGAYVVNRVGEKAICYTETLIWPDDMIYGYLYGAAQRYLGYGVHFTLAYDSSHIRQDMGGQSTILNLKWE
jgi:hypothetical protein